MAQHGDVHGKNIELTHEKWWLKNYKKMHHEVGFEMIFVSVHGNPFCRNVRCSGLSPTRQQTFAPDCKFPFFVRKFQHENADCAVAHYLLRSFLLLTGEWPNDPWHSPGTELPTAPFQCLLGSKSGFHVYLQSMMHRTIATSVQMLQSNVWENREITQIWMVYQRLPK